MPVVTSDLVAQLRAKTGAGLMDCKRALTTTEGDFEKAIQILREQGAASAAKRSGRATAAGLVQASIAAAGKTAVLLELNCETDFVARTDDFKGLLGDLLQKAASAAPAWSSAADAPQERVKELAAKLGENIVLKRFARFDRPSSGLFASYIHPSESVKVGALVELNTASEKGAAAPEAAELGKVLAMQAAANGARWVNPQDVPADLIEKEKTIGREKAKNEGKPEKIWDKIAEGNLKKFFQDFCLLEQADNLNPKSTLRQRVEDVSKKVGEPVTVKRFARFKVGDED
ncbi:MAG: translation elongation factor Ts [Elusimicrobia bacterium]|nr:translation elongation factor Ts [Elusimicrobiota bacterium]